MSRENFMKNYRHISSVSINKKIEIYENRSGN
jgi:hypothetical protein